MKPLLFIHGTGVRKKSYDKTLAEVKRQVATHLKSYEVKECYWGEPYGSKPWSLSLPSGPPAQQAREAEEVALWRNLFEDPFFYLRLLESLPKPPPSFSEAAGVAIWAKLAALQLKPEAVEILEANEMESFWDESAAQLRTETVEGTTNLRWKKAIESIRENAGDVRLAIARCLIALAVNQAADVWIPPMPSEDREQLCRLVVDALGGRDKSIGTFFATLFLGAATLLANPAIRADRGDFTTSITPASGDILLYQARGERMRDFIEERIKEEGKDEPVVIVAHSLGGIATLDLLISKDLWQYVRALVTVGSQAPYLYEIGALWSLEKTAGSTLPTHFPEKRWLNILNRWDFLSYPAQKVFPDHAVDYEVAGISPFPMSHSAYWKNKDTWLEIRRFLS